MDFKVTIDQFDGPLDLMLHLIKEGELDLFDLDIVKLTDQYLLYIRAMRQLHLDIASEYLVELATLIEYKSRKLLPNDKPELEDEYEEDESERLVRRLLEYQRYKEVSGQLSELYQQRLQMHDKPVADIANSWVKVEENFRESTPYALIKAMERCLRRFQLEQPYEVQITTMELTVDERVVQLRKKIRKWQGDFTLQQTMEDCTSIYMVVITFVSLLDMVHDGEINFTVKDNEEVYFSRGAKYE